MTEPEPESRKDPLSKRLFGRELPLETETTLFVFVSALDVFMTYLLLRGGGHYESNPIANWVIARWGIRGMVYYKFSLVAFIAVITQLIAIGKEETARKVLYFATTLTACVVLYSTMLLLRR